MSASAEALRAIRTVAVALGDLLPEVVFVGGVVRGLLVTDPAVEGSRATKDADFITAGISTRAAYYSRIHARLSERGFREDTSEGAPLCRWKLGDIIVDAMPPAGDVLGFSNRWYEKAVETAETVVLPDGGKPIEIRLVTGPYFVATKLEAFAGRGGGDFMASHDLEDVVAIVDGRPSLVDEVERESDALRSYLAHHLEQLLPAGLKEAVPGHLAGDAANQARVPHVLCVLDRLRRHPRVVRLGEVVESTTGGQPGATGQAHAGPWRYEILDVERKPGTSAREHLVVRARLTNLGRVAGTVGDGRDVHIENAWGVRFPPLRKLNQRELVRRGLPADDEQAVPGEPFETSWVYELPMPARQLRLLLPFDQHELPIDV